MAVYTPSWLVYGDYLPLYLRTRPRALFTGAGALGGLTEVVFTIVRGVITALLRTVDRACATRGLGLYVYSRPTKSVQCTEG